MWGSGAVRYAPCPSLPFRSLLQQRPRRRATFPGRSTQAVRLVLAIPLAFPRRVQQLKVLPSHTSFSQETGHPKVTKIASLGETTVHSFHRLASLFQYWTVMGIADATISALHQQFECSIKPVSTQPNVSRLCVFLWEEPRHPSPRTAVSALPPPTTTTPVSSLAENGAGVMRPTHVTETFPRTYNTSSGLG